ncbi:MAG: amidohydrolase family protein [Microbacterium sp.]|uniref:amidohydrolase family protein n=1 Tax=Microbacterium sp. TaxID=51671 RepID=UPI001D3D6E8E|nr:amidohydrolase family protein [Microbacterium sp.]MBW8761095.1 amidohydrolase family protein [Microbacterium sp.]
MAEGDGWEGGDSAVSTVDAMLVMNGDVVTMDTQRRILTEATIAVANGSIVAIGHADDLRARFPQADVLDATACMVIPGLINAHQHATVDPLVRSMIPDDISSTEAIFRWLMPLHEQADGDDDELAATLTAVDCLTRGVTTLLEPGTTAHPLRVAAGLSAVGIRARVGCWGWDAEGMPFAAPAAETIARQEETVKKLPRSALVTGWVTLVGHDLVSDELFTGASELATRLDTGLTWHMSPHGADAAAYLKRCGQRPIVHLDRLGVLGPRLVLGHAVHIDDDELEAIVRTGTAVASCPGAYLRLGQEYGRFGRHGELVRRGGRIALGCDSHNAGDVPDVLHAAYLLTALEHDRGDSGALRAGEALAIATIDGARAVGMSDQIGSIEVGKAADLVVLDTSGPGWVPRGEPTKHLVWGGASTSVRDVLVDGRVVVRDREVQNVDATELRQEAATRSAMLRSRARIEVPHIWPEVAIVSHRDRRAR